MLTNKHMFFGCLAVGAGVALRRYLTADPEVETIRSWKRILEAEGAVVAADLKGHVRPPKIGGHIPDVFAAFPNGDTLAIEVENDRSVTKSHAKRQNAAFSRWAERSRRRAYLQDVVPGGKGRKR